MKFHFVIVKTAVLKKYSFAGQRMAPFYKTVDEEVESTHLRFLQQPTGIHSFFLIVSMRGYFRIDAQCLADIEKMEVESHAYAGYKKHNLTHLCGVSGRVAYTVFVR